MSEVGLRRLRGLQSFETAADVVEAVGALQAQDYLAALWAVGVRLRSGSEAEVERALEARSFVRTWPLRGTLHFVAAKDVRWMLELGAAHTIDRAKTRFTQLGLDEATFKKGRAVLSRALRGVQLTRAEVFSRLKKDGVSTEGQRGIHVLWRLAHEGLLCFGTRAGAQHRFVLLDEWVSPSVPLARQDALARLALRYFTGHGPATLKDFGWWSGLRAADAREALEAASPKLAREVIDGAELWSADTSPGPAAPALLPAFDEFFVGYQDRRHVIADPKAVANGGVLRPMMVMNGRVVGTWQRTLTKKAVKVTLAPFAPLSAPAQAAFSAAASRYAAFVGRARA